MNKNNQDKHSKLSPILKWAGGKRWLLSALIPVFNSYQNFRLVEPFSGGLAVALGLNPAKALLNDLNPHLINFYQQVKQGLTIEQELLNQEELFYQKRTRLNCLISENKHLTKEAAAIFYYLNRTCFNGLCRFNSKGEFNVPYGKYKKINYLSDFQNYTKLFANWDFSCSDFQLLEINDTDFLYVDPPYDVEFTKYSKEDFSWNDQIRLVEWLLKYSNPMLASNQATNRIIELYKSAGFQVQAKAAPRRISCTGDRTPAQEMLASRNIRNIEG